MDITSYEILKEKHQAIEMVRPFWDYSYDPDPQNVTVLICAGVAVGTARTITQLTLESLLRFYPEVPVFIVNGNPADYDLTLYLQLQELAHKNIKVWHRGGINSHGDMMNEAIRQFINTKYVLLFDFDNVVHRGGFIEGMIDQLDSDDNMFATGATMIVSRKGEACGLPENESDILRYAHPSCSLIRRDMYLKVRTFTNHGAPCVYSFIDAEKKGWSVGSFPVSYYESHLSGAGWCNPKTIWYNDHDVMMRPFLTFIVTTPAQVEFLSTQTDHDFEVHTLGKRMKESVIIHDNKPKKEVDNRLYDIRFRVKGEYVCILLENISGMSDSYVLELRKAVIEKGLPDELDFAGLRVVRRKKWQYEDALYSKW